jgi:hypothetical protein
MFTFYLAAEFAFDYENLLLFWFLLLTALEESLFYFKPLPITPILSSIFPTFNASDFYLSKANP